MTRQRVLFIAIPLLCYSFCLQAQELPVADSIAQISHVDIFTSLNTPNSNGHTVKLHQSDLIKRLVDRYTVRNTTKKMMGFRVRIFFDNSQHARYRAFETEASFKELYPDVSTYLSYQDLYFKVTVGNFRTRTDAMRFLNNVQKNYPGAYIVKENINLPSL